MTRRNLLAALRAAEEALDAANTAHAETRAKLAVQTERANLAVEAARDVLAEKQQAEAAAEGLEFWLLIASSRAKIAEEQLRLLLDAPRCLPVLGERADGVGPSPIHDGMVAEGWVA